MKTLAIRLDDDLHAQLAILAKLEGLTIADAIRHAIEQWVGERRSNPEFLARAQQILSDIDREATARRSVIEGLLDASDPAASTDVTPPGAAPATRQRPGNTRKPRGR
jgi:predicted DNA-binding protein